MLKEPINRFRIHTCTPWFLILWKCNGGYQECIESAKQMVTTHTNMVAINRISSLNQLSRISSLSKKVHLTDHSRNWGRENHCFLQIHQNSCTCTSCLQGWYTWHCNVAAWHNTTCYLHYYMPHVHEHTNSVAGKKQILQECYKKCTVPQCKCETRDYHNWLCGPTYAHLHLHVGHG